MKKLFILLVPIFLFNLSCKRNSTEKEETTIRQLKFKKKTSDRRKKGYYLNIAQATQDNYDFRSVLYTGKYLQLAIMSLESGEDLGWETHARSDQFIRVESGTGICLLNDEAYELQTNDAILIPAGARHNILNNNDSLELKLYMLYARPVHKDQISRSTKEEARDKKEYYDGETTE
jgi:mannose-6-phosphate isomerase-like protein (cupin superfamily)